MSEDSELLRRYVTERPQAAFTELVERHIGFVYATALRLLGGASHRADDVTQAVFVDLARKAATLTHRGELLGWLHTSTRFAVAKLQRSEQRRQKYEQGGAGQACDRCGTANRMGTTAPRARRSVVRSPRR